MELFDSRNTSLTASLITFPLTLSRLLGNNTTRSRGGIVSEPYICIFLQRIDWRARALLILPSNHAYAFGVADGLEAGVGVELCEDVFDVIVHRSRADVELISNCSSAVALCQALQKLQLPET